MHRNILSLLRRLSAAVIATVIMVSLTACSKAPEEPTRPPHPSVTTPASTAPEQTTEPPIT